MKHIAEERGSKCNLLECTLEEFDTLRNMLLAEGVEVRTTKIEGGVCTLQIRNTYKEAAECYPNRIMTGKALSNIAEEAIAKGYWRE